MAVHQERDKDGCASHLTDDAAGGAVSGGIAGVYPCVRNRQAKSDNGSAYRSKLCARTCQALGIKHSFTHPYTPRTNGKAERFIQTALREWAYARSYRNSAQRTNALQPWLSYYNLRRAHSALGHRPPISRIGMNNLLQLNS